MDLPAINVAQNKPSEWGDAIRAACAWLEVEPISAVADREIVSRPECRGYVGQRYTSAALQIWVEVEGWSGTVDVRIRPTESSGLPLQQTLYTHYLEEISPNSPAEPPAPIHQEPRPAGEAEAVRRIAWLAKLLWQFRSDLLVGDPEVWKRAYDAGIERNREYTRRFTSPD